VLPTVGVGGVVNGWGYVLGDRGDGAGVTPRPPVPVLVPLFEGAAWIIALYGCPGAPGFEDVVSGFVMLPPEPPVSICNLSGLGADGSSLFCSTGDGITLVGASDDPSDEVGDVPALVVGGVVGGVVSVDVAGFDVLEGGSATVGGAVSAGGVVVWAKAGEATLKAAAAADRRSLFILRFPSYTPPQER